MAEDVGQIRREARKLLDLLTVIGTDECPEDDLNGLSS